MTHDAISLSFAHCFVECLNEIKHALAKKIQCSIRLLFYMMANLKTVKKREELYKCELEKEVKLVKLKCKVCIEFENRITSIKGFSHGWITGTESVKNGQFIQAYKWRSHLYAKDLQKKKYLGASDFNRAVLSSTPIGRLPKTTEEDKEILKSRFNTAYYLAKNERPYSDFPDMIVLQEKME